MIFGIPVEIHHHEYRVGATPNLVKELIDLDHQVLVEAKAGEKSGFSDHDYEAAGATVVPSPEKLYSQSECILKIKSPNPVEYELIRPHHNVFSFFHFFSNLEMTRSLMARGCTCFAYDLVKTAENLRPLLNVDRQIAGQLAMQQSAYFLQAHHGGRGSLLGEAAGNQLTTVTIIGASYSAISAVLCAVKMGAAVTMLVDDLDALNYASIELPADVSIKIRSEQNFKEILPVTDVLISAVQQVDSISQIVISNEAVQLLPKGAVIIDLDIDYGGSVETSTPTTFENPVFLKEGVIHYCVPGITGVVPRTASAAFSEILAPFILKCAGSGLPEAFKKDEVLNSGLAIFEGRITNRKLAEELAVSFYDFNDYTEPNSG